jgi:hypothetical protein
VLSPISGVIVRWHLTGFSGGPFYLQVLTPDGGTTYTGVASSAGETPASTYTGVASSAGETPASTATQTFATDLPIQAGQTIGVSSGSADAGDYGIVAAPPASFAVFDLPLANGSTMTATGPSSGFEFTFNAEVQPAPTITALGVTSGPISGGTSVAITGTDLEGASVVKFGSNPASSYTVDSEGQITAVAPAAAAGTVDVSVTTPAGTATSNQQFTYLPTASTLPTRAPSCVVPKLKGTKLKATKKILKKTDCKLGKVTKKKGTMAKNGKVVKQSPKAGKVLAGVRRSTSSCGSARAPGPSGAGSAPSSGSAARHR